jgi:hypothetical protein
MASVSLIQVAVEGSSGQSTTIADTQVEAGKELGGEKIELDGRELEQGSYQNVKIDRSNRQRVFSCWVNPEGRREIKRSGIVGGMGKGSRIYNFKGKSENTKSCI